MSVLYDAEAYREVYLVFQGKQTYLCSYFFREGFKHVFAIERQALGWICLDPSRQDFCSYILPASFEDEVIVSFKDLNPGSTIVRVEVYPAKNGADRYPKLHIMSCVAVMQYALGVYWPWIISPYQLYYKLLNTTIPHIKAEEI